VRKLLDGLEITLLFHFPTERHPPATGCRRLMSVTEGPAPLIHHKEFSAMTAQSQPDAAWLSKIRLSNAEAGVVSWHPILSSFCDEPMPL
jgi:hypothetical protein